MRLGGEFIGEMSGQAMVAVEHLQVWRGVGVSIHGGSFFHYGFCADVITLSVIFSSELSVVLFSILKNLKSSGS